MKAQAKGLFHASDYQLPDATGHFGPYGGSFVAETLTYALAELNEAYAKYSKDPEFLESSATSSNTSSAVHLRFTTPSAGAKSRAARRSTSSAKT